MNRTFIGAVAISALFFAAGAKALVHAQPQTAAAKASDTQAKTIGLMRSLNTAEAWYKSNHGHFASLDDLYDANLIHHDAPRAELVAAAGTDIIPNLKATVILAPEKDSYALAVYDKAKQDQGFAAFSDPAGVIYDGQPLADADALHKADINLIRTINVAEIRYDSKYGHFADFDTLNAEGLIKSYSNDPATFAKSPDVLPNLQVTVSVPAEQNAWLVALHDKSKETGPYSAYSDPSGITYQAQSLK
jgi:hypothetical protein